MAPQRAKTNQPDDASSTRNPATSTGVSKRSRTSAAANANAAAAKDQASNNLNAQSASTQAIANPTSIDWVNEDLETLQRYRAAYQLEAPQAFNSSINQAILSHGIGRFSPTMARKKERRNGGKDQLALAVRKHFNGLAVNENEVIVNFFYKVKTQDQEFRSRFAPKQKS